MTIDNLKIQCLSLLGPILCMIGESRNWNEVPKYKLNGLFRRECPSIIELLLELRVYARQQGKYKLADDIRDVLEIFGEIVCDLSDGHTTSRCRAYKLDWIIKV